MAKRLTKAALIEGLEAIVAMQPGDTEGNHIRADQLLLDYIHDEGVTELYDSIQKWYA